MQPQILQFQLGTGKYIVHLMEFLTRSNVGPLIRELQSDNSASFYFVEGEVESGPGPGVEGIFEGPYFTFYKWPRNVTDDDKSLNDAYELLSEVIEEEGPFDGVLGFSHGGTLAFGFLAHLFKTKPYEPPPFRCAIFMNAPPPFRMDDSGNFIMDDGLEGLIHIPTLHITGTNDFIYNHSLKLYALCDPGLSTLLVHEKGHQIPSDAKNMKRITNAIRELGNKAAYLS